MIKREDIVSRLDLIMSIWYINVIVICITANRKDWIDKNTQENPQSFNVSITFHTSYLFINFYQFYSKMTKISVSLWS